MSTTIVTEETPLQVVRLHMLEITPVEVNILNTLADTNYQYPKITSQLIYFLRYCSTAATLTDLSSLLPDFVQSVKEQHPDPVYVDLFNHLIYDSNRMQHDKLYRITWDGMQLALMKTLRNGKIVIDLYEFEPVK